MFDVNSYYLSVLDINSYAMPGTTKHEKVLFTLKTLKP